MGPKGVLESIYTLRRLETLQVPEARWLPSPLVPVPCAQPPVHRRTPWDAVRSSVSVGVSLS